MLYALCTVFLKYIKNISKKECNKEEKNTFIKLYIFIEKMHV